MNQLGADAAAVLLYAAEHQELTFAAERGFRSSRIRKVTARSGQRLVGTSSRVARTSSLRTSNVRAGVILHRSDIRSRTHLFKDIRMPRLITLESGSTFGLTEAACT